MEWRSLESCYLVECSRLQALFALVSIACGMNVPSELHKDGRINKGTASLFIGDIRFGRVECAAASMYAMNSFFLSFSSILGMKMNSNRNKSGGKITLFLENIFALRLRHVFLCAVL